MDEADAPVVAMAKVYMYQYLCKCLRYRYLDLERLHTLSNLLVAPHLHQTFPTVARYFICSSTSPDTFLFSPPQRHSEQSLDVQLRLVAGPGRALPLHQTPTCSAPKVPDTA